MTIHMTTVVLAEHEIDNVDRQVQVPDVNEVPPRQNPDHLAEPLNGGRRTQEKRKVASLR